MARRTGADSQITWESIVEAARHALRADGVEAFSLRRVAEIAGYRLGTLQYYFPQKTALLETVLGEGYRTLLARVAEAERAMGEGRALPELAPSLAVSLYRLARDYRQLSRARMASNLIAGRMSEDSVENLLRAERLISKALLEPVDRARLRLGLHSLSVLILRYASHPPDELARIVGVETPEAAYALVEAHLAELARGEGQAIVDQR